MWYKFPWKKPVVVPGPKNLVPAWLNPKNGFAETSANFLKYLNTATQNGNTMEFQYGVSANEPQDASLAEWTIAGQCPAPMIKYGLPIKGKLFRVCFDDVSQSSILARAESAKMSPCQTPLEQVIELVAANGENPTLISSKRLLELLQEAAGLGIIPKNPAFVITEVTGQLNCISGKNPGEIFVHGMTRPDNKPWLPGSLEGSIMSKTVGVVQYWNDLSQHLNLEKP